MQLVVKKGTKIRRKTSRKYKDLCDNNDLDFTPLHFYDHPVEVLFDIPPAREKAPDCPNGFIWEDRTSASPKSSHHGRISIDVANWRSTCAS
jgi:hypothetical protein